MNQNDQAIEQQIQAKGKTAPRVTPADIEANIASEHYINAGDACIGPIRHDANFDAARALDCLTFCVLVLKNGFTVTGESACASPENFDAEIGRNIARQNAVQKIWPLMGYQLRDQLHNIASMPLLADSVPSTVETKTYADGTTATGTAPLPDLSPTEQDAAKG